MSVPVETVSMSELRGRFVDKLGKYALFDQFFGDMLRRRLGTPGWLDNALVHLVIDDIKDNLESIEAVLRTARESAPEALDAIKNEIRGDEGEFDQAINDIWAEVEALNWLVTSGYSNIKKIPRSDKQPTPDFEAKKDDCSHYVEVKNFRVPSALMNIAITALENQHLIHPALYGNKRFSLKLDDRTRLRTEVDDTDRLHVGQFVRQVHDALIGGDTDVSYTYVCKQWNRRVSVSVDCSWDDSEQFYVFGRATSFAWTRPVGRSRIPELLPFFHKTWLAVERAVRQLASYQMDVKAKRLILLDWQKPPRFDVDPELQERYRSFIRGLDGALKKTDSDLGLHLL